MKKYITILFLIVLITPTVTSASWWNPTSWFNRSVKEDSMVEISESEVTPILENSKKINIDSERKESQINQENKVKEKIIEKPIIKTITVQDPALQAKIDALILENNVLRAEIVKLKEANKTLNSELTSTPKSTVTSEFAQKCLEAKSDILDLNKQLENLNNKYTNKYEESIADKPDSKYLASDAYKQSLTVQKNNEAISIKKTLAGAKENMELYCD